MTWSCMDLSNGSSSCRIEWRPSRLLCVAFAGLGLLGAIAIGLSGIPTWLKPALALLALWHGARLARHEWRSPRRVLELGSGSEPPVLIGAGRRQPVSGARLQTRGALSTLSWLDESGRRRSLRWCADTLSPERRRQLRLRFAPEPARPMGGLR